MTELPRIVLGMTYTQATWVFFGVGLLVVEIVALVRGDPPLTDAMQTGADRWMLWPALFGTFVGHFFGERLRVAEGWGPWVLAALGAAIIVRDLRFPTRVAGPTQFQVALFFACLAALLWGRR